MAAMMITAHRTCTSTIAAVANDGATALARIITTNDYDYYHKNPIWHVNLLPCFITQCSELNVLLLLTF